ncbi:hypothetical protein I312_106072 [Cryptococcus bacillisporus CA1280]|uniref:uncharacterized protein n=1 Tax=Cryptococcus bacillisporus CA1280 TaxID=1296109 RepID=UPI0033669AC5
MIPLALASLLLATLAQDAHADSNLDFSRVGTPEVVMNLTCSTNVEFLLVATNGCDDCVEDGNACTVTDSSSVITSQVLSYLPSSTQQALLPHSLLEDNLQKRFSQMRGMILLPSDQLD